MTLDTRRHMELFDADSFTTPIHIIGAGATGSWLALMLAKLGIKGDLIHAYDFDHVEEHNVPNQLYSLGDAKVKRDKVEALYDILAEQTGTRIKISPLEFKDGRLSGYVFIMTDTMKSRKQIWERSIKMKQSVKLLIEPRMGLDLGRIYNVLPTDTEHIRQYEDTFYTDEEAETSACGTSQSVITTSTAVASMCVRQLINHHAEVELDNEIIVDFKYNNLITSRW